jgi:hypothetical protein
MTTRHRLASNSGTNIWQVREAIGICKVTMEKRTDNHKLCTALGLTVFVFLVKC